MGPGAFVQTASDSMYHRVSWDTWHRPVPSSEEWLRNPPIIFSLPSKPSCPALDYSGSFSFLLAKKVTCGLSQTTKPKSGPIRSSRLGSKIPGTTTECKASLTSWGRAWPPGDFGCLFCFPFFFFFFLFNECPFPGGIKLCELELRLVAFLRLHAPAPTPFHRGDDRGTGRGGNPPVVSFSVPGPQQGSQAPRMTVTCKTGSPPSWSLHFSTGTRQ